MSQFISESELEDVTSLLNHLNENASGLIAFDVRIIDSNGEVIGELKTTDGGDSYALHVGEFK